MEKVKEINQCRSCESKELTNILSLGEQGLSDFVDQDYTGPNDKFPLEIVFCSKCSLLQQRYTIPQKLLYTDRYGYRSGINQTMRNELSEIVERISEKVDLLDGDIVLDIGCNDGTLLNAYTQDNILRVGFDPIQQMIIYSKAPGSKVDKVFKDYFHYEPFFKQYEPKKAKIITAIAMFYDLDEPNKFVADVKKCLDQDGLFVIQQNYVRGMLEQNAFDNIVHEHLEFYSLTSLNYLLENHGLKIADVTQNNINGGSFRTYIKHIENGGYINPRVPHLLEYEKGMGLGNPQIYRDFGNKIHEICQRINQFVTTEVKGGKRFYIYGASTRGNTLLQTCGLDDSLITAAAERNEDKWGKKTMATNIPIVSEEEARKAKPDYFLILPWHFKKEFIEREKEYLKNGGIFIFPLPSLTIVSKDEEKVY